MEVIGIIIAIIVGIVIAQDANKRGMNGTLWGVCVALLMIVFLPIYFIVRKPKVLY
ncbi:hypothetical protein [Maribellus maritimus]|uniref:hypothetical protein n=1 Tax=Maribellus maritimus TaxID=2870838 RepID=UPI001EEB77DE|nr:hypothetical protein [Maribellus maritimus]MCG6187699.1 hypothetical protein [Maribellus maritimus]